MVLFWLEHSLDEIKEGGKSQLESPSMSCLRSSAQPGQHSGQRQGPDIVGIFRETCLPHNGNTLVAQCTQTRFKTQIF